ncbi:MAG TPA: hypothetical protein VGE64_10175 [Xanthomonadaceae bacterium]
MLHVRHAFARRVHAWIAGACLLAVSIGSAVAQDPAKVRVLIATRDTQQTLQVDFVTKGAMARGMLLPFGGIGNAIAFDARSKEYSATIGPFDRRPALVAAIEKALEGKYPVFDIIDDGATYDDDKSEQALIARAKSQGVGYVLLVDEQFAGLSAGGMASPTHDVSVAMTIRYELYETAKGNRMAKERTGASSLTRIPLEQALTDRAFLEAQLPGVLESTARFVVGGLMRTDSLHRMAASIGQGDAVPALSALLKRHESRVHMTTVPPKSWANARTGTRYMAVVQPKSELRFKLGVTASVDLLVAEFGQDVDTIEEYQQAVFTRLSEVGFDPATAQARTDFSKEGYTALSVTNPETGGGQLILFRKIDDLYVAVIIIVATENFEQMLATHKPVLQSAVDGMRIEIK